MICTRCNVDKHITMFCKDTSSALGYRRTCKSCRLIYVKNKAKPEGHDTKLRQYAIKTKYGITPKDYDDMYNSQGGVCAICKRPERHVSHGIVRRLCVDHCHTTNKVRGLLCTDCNIALGKLEDNVSSVKAMLRYLTRK